MCCSLYTLSMHKSTRHVTYMNESCQAYVFVMSHIRMILDTHVDAHILAHIHSYV